MAKTEKTELEQYLELVEQRKAEKIDAGNVLSLPMPSGMVFRYIPFSIAQYLVAGRIPNHLLAKLKSVKKQPKTAFSDAEAGDLGIAWIIITRDIMLNNLTFPRISLEPKDGHILPEQIDPEDFEYFKNFIMKGGQADANFKS